MRLATCQTEKTYILYDAHSVCDAGSTPQITPALFDADHWRQTGRILGEAPGRGSSLFLDAGHEQWVLRPYRRGGLIARVSAARYLWTGLERTRGFRELRLTAHLFAHRLPVPRPVATAVTRHGAGYTAALITVRIPGARTLAELLAEQRDDPGSEQLLASYAQRRREDRERTLEFSDGLARVTANDAPLLRPLRALGMLAVDRLPALQARVAGGAMGYRGQVPALCRRTPA